MLNSCNSSFICNVNMWVYSETFWRQTSSAWPFYSAGILLNIPLAPVALSQLSTCLSKAAVTEKQHHCCCDYNRELKQTDLFSDTRWWQADNTLIISPVVTSVSNICLHFTKSQIHFDCLGNCQNCLIQ